MIAPQQWTPSQRRWACLGAAAVITGTALALFFRRTSTSCDDITWVTPTKPATAAKNAPKKAEAAATAAAATAAAATAAAATAAKNAPKQAEAAATAAAATAAAATAAAATAAKDAPKQAEAAATAAAATATKDAPKQAEAAATAAAATAAAATAAAATAAKDAPKQAEAAATAAAATATKDAPKQAEAAATEAAATATKDAPKQAEAAATAAAATAAKDAPKQAEAAATEAAATAAKNAPKQAEAAAAKDAPKIVDKSFPISRTPERGNSSFDADAVAQTPGTRRRLVAGCTPRSTRALDDGEDRWSVYGVSIAKSESIYMVDFCCPETFVQWRMFQHRSGCRVYLVAEDLDCLEGKTDAARFEESSLAPFKSLGKNFKVVERSAASAKCASIFSTFTAAEVYGDDSVLRTRILMFSAVVGTLGVRLVMDGLRSSDEDTSSSFLRLVASAAWVGEDITWKAHSFVKYFVASESKSTTFSVPVAYTAAAVLADGAAIFFEEKHSDCQLLVATRAVTPAAVASVLPHVADSVGLDDDIILFSSFSLNNSKLPVGSTSAVKRGKYLPIYTSSILVFSVPSPAHFKVAIIEHRFGDKLTSMFIATHGCEKVARVDFSVVAFDDEEALLEDIISHIAAGAATSSSRRVGKNETNIVSVWGPSASDATSVCVDALLFGAAADEWLLVEWTVKATDLDEPEDAVPSEIAAYRNTLLTNVKVRL